MSPPDLDEHKFGRLLGCDQKKGTCIVELGEVEVLC